MLVSANAGGMHVIQSFVGCIAKLIKSSGLEVYITIITFSRVKAMRGFSWCVSSTLEAIFFNWAEER